MASENALHSHELELQARIESLKAHASSRGGLIEELTKKRDLYVAGLEWTQEQLGLLPAMALETAAGSLTSALQGLQKQALDEMESYWRRGKASLELDKTLENVEREWERAIALKSQFAALRSRVEQF